MKWMMTSLAALMISSAPALAWDYVQNGPGQQIGDNATGVQNNNRAQASASARSSASSSSASRATGGTAYSGGGSSAVTVNNGGGRIPVSSAIAPSMTVLAPCGSGVAASGAVSTGIFGFSLGGSAAPDDMCRIAAYAANPIAFQWACRSMKGFREAAMDAGSPCAMDRVEAVVERREAAMPPDEVRRAWREKAAAAKRVVVKRMTVAVVAPPPLPSNVPCVTVCPTPGLRLPR